MGADIPLATEYTRNLQTLLNLFGNNPDFTLILFTVDETTFSRELAPLAGHYPAIKLGPPWWFFDSWNGMTRYRQAVSETAGLYNTAASTTTPAYVSIPARHDLALRRRELAGESGGAQRDRHGGCRRDGACRSLRSRQEGLQAGLNEDTTPNRLLSLTAISDHT